MGNGWTPERQARQAVLIRTWRPWEQSTGPPEFDSPAAKIPGCANEIKDLRLWS